MSSTSLVLVWNCFSVAEIEEWADDAYYVSQALRLYPDDGWPRWFCEREVADFKFIGFPTEPGYEPHNRVPQVFKCALVIVYDR